MAGQNSCIAQSLKKVLEIAEQQNQNHYTTFLEVIRREITFCFSSMNSITIPFKIIGSIRMSVSIDDKQEASPEFPAVRITFRVGVAGHRHLEAVQLNFVKNVTSNILKQLANDLVSVRDEKFLGYSDAQPEMKLLSSLAEGADRAVADAYLTLDPFPVKRRLLAVLPFPKEEYLLDFKEQSSRTCFDTLLSRSNHSIVATYGRSDEWQDRLPAYQAASRIILDHSDILIMVLDPTSSGRQGGTLITSIESEQARVPSIRINPVEQVAHLVTYTREGAGQIVPLTTNGTCVDTSCIRETVHSLITPPYPIQAKEPLPHHRDATTYKAVNNGTLISTWPPMLMQYFHEAPLPQTGRAMYHVYQFPWRFLQQMAPIWGKHEDKWIWAVSLPLRLLISICYLVQWLWKRLFKIARRPRQSEKEPVSHDLLDRHYRRAHELAVRYSVFYRGSFLWNYSLGALAVTAALLTYADIHRELLWGVVELIAIVLVFVNYLVSRHYSWHERHVQYRVLAEFFRHMRYLHRFAIVPAMSQPMVYRRTGDPQITWMNWHFRAVFRTVEMPSSLPQGKDLEHARYQLLGDWIEKQRNYHRDQAHRSRCVTAMLRRFCFVFFFGASIACVAHVGLHGIHSSWQGIPWLTLFAAALPAWCGASHAICVQGEFDRMIERSEETCATLEEVINQMKALTSPLRFPDVGQLALRAAEAMFAEISDWRILSRVAETQPA